MPGPCQRRVELLEKGGRRAADVSDVVVYLDGPKVKNTPAKATVTMRGKEFRPRVVVVPSGGTVDFPNEDGVFHNVFSVSGENRFDLDLYKKPQEPLLHLPASRRGARVLQHPPADERRSAGA